MAQYSKCCTQHGGGSAALDSGARSGEGTGTGKGKGAGITRSARQGSILTGLDGTDTEA